MRNTFCKAAGFDSSFPWRDFDLFLCRYHVVEREHCVWKEDTELKDKTSQLFFMQNNNEPKCLLLTVLTGSNKKEKIEYKKILTSKHQND